MNDVAPTPPEMPKAAPADRAENGPFDFDEANNMRPYVDLGAIKVTPREGLNIRLDVEESSKRIIAVSLDYAESSLQVQAFSAPRSSGLWEEIRAQVAAQIASQGGESTPREGALGTELLAQVKVPAQGGKPAEMRLARFIGVDGPRWFLRGTVSGKGATDPKAAEQIDELFRSLVVVRGNVPMPPRELIPMRMPDGMYATEA